MERINLQFRYRPEDVLAGYQLHFQRTLHIKLHFAVSFASVSLGIFYLVYAETAKVGVLLIILPLILMGILGFFYYYLPIIFFRRQDTYRGEYQCITGKKGITLIREGNALECDWRVFIKGHIGEKVIILYYERNRFTIIPRRVFSDNDNAESEKAFLATISSGIKMA